MGEAGEKSRPLRPASGQPGWAVVRSWFALTVREIVLLAVIAVIFIVGLAVRWHTLGRQTADVYTPAAVAPAAEKAGVKP